MDKLEQFLTRAEAVLALLPELKAERRPLGPDLHEATAQLTNLLNHKRVVVVADIYAAERNDRFMEDLVARISIEPDVKAVSWSRVQG